MSLHHKELRQGTRRHFFGDAGLGIGSLGLASLLTGGDKTYEAAKHMTRLQFGVSATSFLTVNRDTWDGFPPKVKKIFRDVAKGWAPAQRKIDYAKLAKFTGIMKKKGVKMAEFPAAERRRWAMAMPNIAKEWADRLEKRKVPGRAVLSAFMDELRARKIDIARQWDRE